MATFGKTSLERIATLHPDLQRVLHRAIKIMDFSVLCGLRDEQAQTEAKDNKRSKLSYPHSRHNRSLQKDNTYNYEQSDAVDIAPYPILWPDHRKQTAKDYVRRMGRFYMLAGVIITVAIIERVPIKWGGTFKNFFDGPHFERITS